MRWKASRGCVACTTHHVRQSYQKHKERLRFKRLEKLASDPSYRPRHNQTCREWAKKNPEKVKEAERKYLKTERGRAKANFKARKRHATKKASSVSFFTEEAMLQHFQSFGFRELCAWCHKKEWKQIDHFTPLSKGGLHSLANLVPACGSCNASKRDRDPKQWFQRQPFYSKERWDKIIEILSRCQPATACEPTQHISSPQAD